MSINPADFPSLVFWLDSADTSTFTLSGNNVSQWNDKSGKGCQVIQNTVGNQPIRTSATSGVKFEGNAAMTQNANNVPVFRDATAITVLAVVTNTALISYNNIISFRWNSLTVTPATTGKFSLLSGYNSVNKLTLEAYNGATATVLDSSNTNMPLNTPTLIGCYASSISTAVNINSTLFSTTPFSVNATSSDALVILGYPSYCSNIIYELMVFNSALTTSQRYIIEGYLTNKWNMQNKLPITHPYYSLAPTPTSLIKSIPNLNMWLDATDNTTISTVPITISYNAFLTTSPVEVSYSSTNDFWSLDNWTPISATTGGVYLGTTTAQIAKSATPGIWYCHIISGQYCCMVKIQFSLASNKIYVKAVAASYVSTAPFISSTTTGVQNDAIFNSGTATNISTATGQAGYGIQAISMSVPVYTWYDKSDSKNNVVNQAIAPLCKTNLINGLSAMDLTNNGGFASLPFTNNSNASFAMVLVTKSGIGSYGSFFHHGNRDMDFILERNGGSTALLLQTANDGTGNINYIVDQPVICFGTLTSGTSRFFEQIGGGTTTSVTASNTNTLTVANKRMYIGLSDNGEACNSYIGEFLYFTSVLTSQQQQLVEGYLAWKWGLTGSLSNTHVYKYVAPYSMNYLSNLLTNSALWLDGGDPNTLFTDINGTTPVTANAQAVNYWKNKSTSYINMTKNGSNAAPLYNTSTLNGRSVVNFPTKMLESNLAINPNPMLSYNGIDATIFFVTNIQGDGSAYGIPYTIATNDNNYMLRMPWGNSDKILDFGDRLTYNSNLSNQTVILTLSRSGVNMYFYKNGGLLASKNNALLSALITTTLQKFYIGGHPTLNTWYGSYIAEMIIFNKGLNDSDRLQVEGYLAWKWGLQSSLINGHPFKSSPPGNYTYSNVLTNYTTDMNSVTNFVYNISDTVPNIFLNLKSSLKTSEFVDASRNDVKYQYISSLLVKNNNNVFDISNSTDLFSTSTSVKSGLTNKNVKVLLPTISEGTGTLTLPTTSSSNFYHLEMPSNTPVSITNVAPSGTLSYNGTNTVTYNGQNKVIGDTITIGSKTYQIVALGSITLDETAAGVGGDPHIYPLNGKQYDLPNEKGKFLLFDNNKEDNIKLICECDFLTKQEIGDSKYINRNVLEGTFITKLWIKHNNEATEINMKDISVITNSSNFNISEIYEDKYIFRKHYSSFKISQNKIRFDGKSRNIKINTVYGEYNIKTSMDLNCADHRNQVEIFGPDIPSGIGALISKELCKKI